MKVFLDDVRPTPEGWVRCYWPSEVIALIEQGGVEVVSLDHDLGDDSRGTGYDVCAYLEEKVFTQGFDEGGDFIPPALVIHSANPVGRDRMGWSIKMVYHHFKTTAGAVKPEAWEELRRRIALAA